MNQKIGKVHLDQLHYWESVDFTKRRDLVLQYVQFMDYLYEKYDLDICKHKIDRKTGEILPMPALTAGGNKR